MSLVSVDNLRKTFEVNAKFYYASVNGESFLMRREARITRKNVVQEKSDAVVVMINPGSCKPSIKLNETTSNQMEFVPADSDQTQEQLMNLMIRKNWNVLVILNLSDICEGNLDRFKSIEKKFTAAGVPHSIFQDVNALERDMLLSATEHLIFAWGSSLTAKRLAKEFMLYDKGVASTDYKHMVAWIHYEKLFPRHPRPALIADRITWLDVMESLLLEVPQS
ncbi:DUF1643 domain-containing protein [Planomicrobium chinense]|uniref:hypothetical protein n=1 Tax=Planococcus chinensis TaxID=272917 RepID=UPI001CC6718C|nr:hypothetical protein [Planococcus chinensis]MBZ5201988.1 DUF1643 domain-containing protein [Planococcus chinensis]